MGLSSTFSGKDEEGVLALFGSEDYILLGLSKVPFRAIICHLPQCIWSSSPKLLNIGKKAI